MTDSTPRAVVFDISGTLRWGRTPIPQAAEALSECKALGLAVRCLSNNASESPREVAGWFREQGFNLAESEVLTANELAAEYVGKRFRNKPVMALGTESLRAALQREGATLKDDGPVEAVLVGLGFRGPVDRAAVDRGIEAIRAGAAFLAIGPDQWDPVGEGRFLPAVGSFTRAFARATGRRPILMGKPGRWAARRLLESLDLTGPQLVMAGDHLESDIGFGQRLGSRTALVLTGCTLPWEKAAVLVAKHPPTVVLETVADLPAWLRTVLL